MCLAAHIENQIEKCGQRSESQVSGYCGLLFFATFWASWRFAGLRGASPVKFETSQKEKR